ncbi:MAG: hypothetical protein ACRDD1_02435, partial [Planctomycetia bacterium]
MLAASYRSAPLPPNSLSPRDAALLADRTLAFALEHVGGNPGASLSLAQMNDRLAKLGTLSPSASWLQTWWFGEKGTALCYVNALGVVLPAAGDRPARPVLLPGDTAVAEDVGDKVVAVADVVDRLASAPADRKLLVLDCQRAEQVWPIGVLAEDFVAAVEALLKTLPADRRRNLYVLYSCSPGERSWDAPEFGRTAFGHFFVRGLSGGADDPQQTNGIADRNGRVHLSELTKYLQERVGDWARSQRAEAQTPRLTVFDDAPPADAVALASPGWGESPPEPTAVRWDDAVVERLRQAWRRHAQLAGRAPPPLHRRPQTWRLMEENLMRAEEFGRAGDAVALTDALTIAESRLDDLEAISGATVDGVAPPSLAMAEYLRGGPPAKEKNPRGPDFAGVVTAAVEGRLDAPAAAKRLESVQLVAPTPPSETVLLRAAGKAAADRSA